MNISSVDRDALPPPGWRRLSEASSVIAHGFRQFGHLNARGPAGGAPALVIPGFIANDRTTMELRRALAAAGWRVHPWALGMNLGAKVDTIEQIKARLDAIDPVQPVLLVGWSLGGVYAREVARAFPERVRAVVTLGSPFSGDPRANNVWRLYEWIAGHPVDNPPVAHSPAKPPVPTLALWSGRDGIVCARAARGLPHESDRTVELTCSHMAFSVSRRDSRRVALEISRFVEDIGGDGGAGGGIEGQSARRR